MEWQERMEEKLNALNGLNEQVAQLVGLIQMVETRRMLQSVETKVDQIRGSIVQDLAAVEFTVHKAASDIAALKLAR